MINKSEYLYTPGIRMPPNEGGIRMPYVPKWNELDPQVQINAVKKSETEVEKYETSPDIRVNQLMALVNFVKSTKEWELYGLYGRFGEEEYDRQHKESAINACRYHAKGCEEAEAMLIKLENQAKATEAESFFKTAATLTKWAIEYEREN